MPAEIEVMMRKAFSLIIARYSVRTEASRQFATRYHGARVEFLENPQLPALRRLEFALGTGFSTNPEFLWAREILKRPESAIRTPHAGAEEPGIILPRETRRSRTQPPRPLRPPNPSCRRSMANGAGGPGSGGVPGAGE